LRRPVFRPAWSNRTLPRAPAWGQHIAGYATQTRRGVGIHLAKRRSIGPTLQRHAKNRGYELEIFYSNIEGEAINRIYRAVDEGFDGLVMNPAGFTYAGFALKDCIKGAALPYVEVHISNIAKRNIHCVLSDAAEGMITGFGMHSYILGLEAMLEILRTRKGAP
jgi:3-dehydroquinate dehydratase-2